VRAAWDRLWRWLEQHLPDLTAVFDDDDEVDGDRLVLRLYANPGDLPVLEQLVDDATVAMRPTVLAAVLELVKLGFTAAQIRDAALAATLSLSGPDPERAERAAVAIATLTHRFGMDADGIKGTPSVIRSLSHLGDDWWPR
jgi:hypothetical protein